MIALRPTWAAVEQLALLETPVDPSEYEHSGLEVAKRFIEPWDIHLTLLYFEDVSLEQIGAIVEATRNAAKRVPTVVGKVAGYAEFGAGDEGGSPCVALVDSLDLIPLRQTLIAAMPDGVEYSKKHGFIPHMTLAYGYGAPDPIQPRKIPEVDLIFREIEVVYGFDGVREVIPFGGSLGTRKTMDDLKNEWTSIMQKSFDDAPATTHASIVPESVTTEGTKTMTNTILQEPRQKEGKRLSRSMVDKLAGAAETIGSLLKWGRYEDESEEEVDQTTKADHHFFVVKDVKGEDRWVSISSNGFQDREKEIVATDALKAEVARADSEGDRGPLILWHTPGTEFGDCDFQEVEGRFLIESGTFRNTEFAQAVKASLKSYAGPLGISIGFRHPADQPDANGVFGTITKIIERSVCPLSVVANPFTTFNTLYKEYQQMNDAKRGFFAELIGAERADAIIEKASSSTKDLESLYAYKAIDELNEKADADDSTKTDDETEKAKKKLPPFMKNDDDEDDEDEDEKEKAKTALLLEGIADIVSTAIAPQTNAIKATDEILKALVDTTKALDARLRAVEAASTEKATSNAPRGLRIFRASEAESNVVEKTEAEKVAGDPPMGTPSAIAPYIADLIKKGA